MEAPPGKSDHSMNDFTVHSSPFSQEGEMSWEIVISKPGSLKDRSCIFEKASIHKIKISLGIKG